MRGGVREYAAQEIPQIDTASKDRFRMEASCETIVTGIEQRFSGGGIVHPVSVPQNDLLKNSLLAYTEKKLSLRVSSGMSQSEILFSPCNL